MPKGYNSITIKDEDYAKVVDIKTAFGFKSLAEVVIYLIDHIPQDFRQAAIEYHEAQIIRLKEEL